MSYNTWLPGNLIYDFNDGVSRQLGNVATSDGGSLLAQTFTIPNAQAGFGFTFDMVDPPFTATKPPKVYYSCTSDMILVLKDGDGWMWAAPCPKQDTAKERGWAWSQFALHSQQENTGTAPNAPNGRIQAYQFSGAEDVHGPNNNIPQSISLCYVAGRSPKFATTGDIRTVTITDRDQSAHVLKIGDVALVDGSRVPIQYLGALPFGLQMNGPRNRLAVLPYRGPIVAGYQAGAPWVSLNDNTSLGGMLEFMLESQHQFQMRNPNNVFGPFMHSYLQAIWDCEQTGTIDTWVWEGPDGNPTWDGWQYRAFDAMSRGWYEATKVSTISKLNLANFQTLCSRFLDWLYEFFMANENVLGVPNDWKPTDWVVGTDFPPDSYLDPKWTGTDSHDCALALKGAVFCQLAGYDTDKAKYVIKRCIEALISAQYLDPSNTDQMRGAFTFNPAGFEVYGFHQGEVMEALALCKQHPDLLTHNVPT